MLAHTVRLPSGTFVNCDADPEEGKRENDEIKELPLVSAAVRNDFNDSDLDTRTIFLYHNIVPEEVAARRPCLARIKFQRR